MEGPGGNREPAPNRLNGRFWGLTAIAVLVAIAFAVPLMTPAMVGFLNDDGYYATTARALAAGQGYVHPFAPAPEPAYRYPVLYPALLAATTGWVADLQAQLVAMQALSLASLGLVIVLCALFLARGLRLAPVAAVGVALVVGLHPHVLRLSSQVMSDVPFTALSMGALLVFARAESTPRRRWLAAAGLLMGLMVLMRYQGLTLGVAAIAALLFSRRFKDAGWTAIGFLAPLLPWAAWAATRSGPWYQSVFREIAGTYGDSGVLLAGSAKFVLLSALPSSVLAFLAPPASNDPLLQHLHPGLALLAVLVSLVILLGAAQAAARPHALMERVVAWYFWLTLVMVVVWNSGFVFLGYQQAVRLMIPLIPLAIYFAGRGVLMIGARSRLAPSGRVAAACLGLAVLVGLATAWQHRDHRLLPPDRAAGYQRVFAHLKLQTPPDAVIGTAMPPMVYLYTGRKGAPYSLQDPDRFLRSVREGHLDYLFLNRRLYRYLGTGEDVVGMFLADVEARYPGLLHLQYQDPDSGMEVWAVRRGAIAGERPDHRPLGGS